MSRLLSGYHKVRSGVSSLVGLFGELSSIVVILMVIAVTVDVTTRDVFNHPIPGVLEATQLGMVLVVFLSLALTQSRRGHVRVEVLFSRLSSGWRFVFDIFAHLLGLAFFGLMVVVNVPLALHSWRVGESEWGLIKFPMWPGKILLTLGVLLLCLQFIIDIVQLVRDRFGAGETRAGTG